MEIQAAIAINFISFKENDEERVIYSKSDNIEIIIYDKADEVIKEPFESLLNRRQIRLDWIDCNNFLHYKFHKIYLNFSGSFSLTFLFIYYYLFIYLFIYSFIYS